MKAENVKNEPVTIPNPNPDVLGGTAAGTHAGNSGGEPDTTSGTGTGTDTTSGNAVDTNRDISTRSTGGNPGDGEGQVTNGTIGSKRDDIPTTQPQTRRGRKPRTATGTTTDEKPTQTVLELAAPVSINLNTGRRSKAKPLAIKSESIADALVLGFGVLEKQRGPHWKRTKAECEPFSKSIAGLIPDLPPDFLKALEKSAPWVSLAVTGTMLFLPSILAEWNIAKMRAELAELERKNGIKSPITNPNADGNTSGSNRGTNQGSGNSPTAGSGTGDGSSSERPADDRANAPNDSSVSPFGKFGNVVV